MLALFLYVRDSRGGVWRGAAQRAYEILRVPLPGYSGADRSQLVREAGANADSTGTAHADGEETGDESLGEAGIMTVLRPACLSDIPKRRQLLAPYKIVGPFHVSYLQALYDAEWQKRGYRSSP